MLRPRSDQLPARDIGAFFPDVPRAAARAAAVIAEVRRAGRCSPRPKSSAIEDQLRAAVHTEHRAIAPRRSVTTLATTLGRKVLVDDTATLWAVANQCGRSSMIEVGAWVGLPESAHHTPPPLSSDAWISIPRVTGGANTMVIIRVAPVVAGSYERSRITLRAPSLGFTLALTELGPKPGTGFVPTALVLGRCVLSMDAAENAAHATGLSPHPSVKVGEHHPHTSPHGQPDEP